MERVLSSWFWFEYNNEDRPNKLLRPNRSSFTRKDRHLLLWIDFRVTLRCVGSWLLHLALLFVERTSYINQVCWRPGDLLPHWYHVLLLSYTGVIIGVFPWDYSTNILFILVTYMHATLPSRCMYLWVYIPLNWNSFLNFTCFRSGGRYWWKQKMTKSNWSLLIFAWLPSVATSVVHWYNGTYTVAWVGHSWMSWTFVYWYSLRSLL